MDKDFEEFVEQRCDSSLQKNCDYLDLQGKLADAHSANDIDTYCELSFRMQIIVERVCYKLAIKDMHDIITEQL